MIQYIQSKLERFSGRDVVPKAVSLFLAITLWAYVSNSKMGELKFKIPVSYEHLPANMMVSYVSHKYITATVQGKNEYLKSVHDKNIKATVDLKNPEIGKTGKYLVTMVKKGFPENIKVSFNRKMVDITVEMIIYKKIRVIPKIFGNVKKDYFVGKIVVEPEFILAEGPQSMIDGMQSIFTNDISIAGAEDNITRDVDLNVKDYKGVSFSEPNVKVNIPIIKYGNLYRLEVPITIKNTDKGFIFKLSESAVKVYIKSTDKRRLMVDDIEAFVDFSKVNMKNLFEKKKSLSRKFPVKILFKNKDIAADIISTAPENVQVSITRK